MPKKVLVTGGASFIGSHLVDRLVARGDMVTILDDLSSGSLDNLIPHTFLTHFYREDLRDYEGTKEYFRGQDVVYHLAADHGGRGYVDYHQIACSNNFAIDQNVYRAVQEYEVPKVVFASSGCIYPLQLQTDTKELLYLREEEAGPPYYPDGLYGMAKLVGELTLKRLWEEKKIKGCSCRFFTVYGPRAKENHAIIAMIARSFIKQDPFEVWGDGTQIRNWTYVDDIADGLIAGEGLAERKGYDVINLGTMERIRVIDAVRKICEMAGYSPEIKLRTDMPTGPMNRVADNSRMVKELGLEALQFNSGVEKTFEWYYGTKDRKWVEQNLQRVLIERK